MTAPGLARVGERAGIEGLLRKLSDLQDRVAANQAAPVPLAAILSALFDTPGGTARITTPEQYGALATAGVDDWEAISEAVSQPGLVLFDPLKTYAVGQPVTPAAGAFLWDGRLGRALTGMTGATVQALNSFSGGDAVVQFADATVGGGVSLNIAGLGNIASALGGVVIGDNCYNVTVAHAWIGNLSDSAVRMLGHPVACRVVDGIFAYDLTGRTLTGPTGVLEVRGSDHYFGESLEVNAGPSHPGGPFDGADRVSYPGEFWRCAVLLDGECHNMNFFDVVAEFGDTNWYVNTTANLNRWTASRSDYSSGPGWYVLGRDSVWLNCQTNGAGFGSAYDGNFYDGALLTGTATRNRFVAFEVNNGGAPHLVRYGWRDETTGNGLDNENLLIDPIINAADCFADTVYRAEPRTAIARAGSGPLRDRPPSRLANGVTYADTDRNAVAYSNGSAWLDVSFGAPAGNIVTPRLAEGIGGTLQIVAADSSCTVGAGYWLLGAAHRLFSTALVAGVACTADGAAAGFMTAIAASDLSGLHTPVTAGVTYTFEVRTVAETDPATVSLVVNWFDSGNIYLSSTAVLTASGGGTNSTSAATDTYWHGVVAPVGAAYAEPAFQFARAGMVAGEVVWLNCLAIVPDTSGLVTSYVRP